MARGLYYSVRNKAPLKLMKYTAEQYNALQAAFDYFNDKLFSGTLDQVIMTLTRKKNAKGYYWNEAYQAGENKVSEIALNPEVFNRDDKDIFSTLVHEMVHAWQFKFGQNIPKRPYHNKEWARKMKEVGLQPTTDGTPNGKETGTSCTHFVIENGKYERAFNQMDKTIAIWIKGVVMLNLKKKKDDGKVKFTCPECEATCWGKSSLLIQCMECEQQMTPEDKE